jgi:hypothetical protein
MQAAPMARLQQKKQAAVTTGSAGATGIPRAMVLRLIRTLPGDRALLPPSSARSLRVGPEGSTSLSRIDLIPASGDQDHTISPCESMPLVQRHQHAHRIPRPTLVTIA